MVRKDASVRPQGNRHGNRRRLGVPAGLVLAHKTRRCLIDNDQLHGRGRREGHLPKGRAISSSGVSMELVEGAGGSLSFHRIESPGAVPGGGDY